MFPAFSEIGEQELCCLLCGRFSFLNSVSKMAAKPEVEKAAATKDGERPEAVVEKGNNEVDSPEDNSKESSKEENATKTPVKSVKEKKSKVGYIFNLQARET